MELKLKSAELRISAVTVNQEKLWKRRKKQDFLSFFLSV